VITTSTSSRRSRLMVDKEWTHDQLMQLCDAANKLTPDEMRRHIVWFALMSEEGSKADG
jgi:hypothetical protein